MKKLEIFGDSILQGVIYSEEEKKYRLFSENKFDSVTAQGVEVVNNARMGATVEKGLSRMQKALDVGSNTTVLLEFGGNDCDFDWGLISENPEIEIEAKIPEKKFTALLAEAINYARSRGADVAVATLIPIDAEKYMNWISRNLNYNNILRWLGDVSMLSRWQEYYNRLVEETASRLKCRIVDLRSTFLLSHSYKTMLCADGIHPTEKGHALIHDIISEFALAN